MSLDDHQPVTTSRDNQPDALHLFISSDGLNDVGDLGQELRIDADLSGYLFQGQVGLPLQRGLLAGRNVKHALDLDYPRCARYIVGADDRRMA